MFSRYLVSGTSMLPAFQPGNRVVTWRHGTVRKGDVIVFCRNGMTMIKRAVQKNGDRWLVRGDNCPVEREVEQGEIQGKVVGVYER